MKVYLPRSWVDPRLKVGASKIQGKGLLATADIYEGETVMIWGGEIIDRQEYETIWPKYHNLSVVQLDQDHYLGLPITESETIDMYLNHSCDPNTWLIDEVTVIARRDIKAGEEITLESATWNDYEGEEYADNDLCTCGSSNCRGKVTPRDWMIPEIQERFKGHFSPYLQRRIDSQRVS
jgi:uncharacterized protein